MCASPCPRGQAVLPPAMMSCLPILHCVSPVNTDAVELRAARMHGCTFNHEHSLVRWCVRVLALPRAHLAFVLTCHHTYMHATTHNKQKKQIPMRMKTLESVRVKTVVP
jgi:hypothetical protein